MHRDLEIDNGSRLVKATLTCAFCLVLAGCILGSGDKASSSSSNDNSNSDNSQDSPNPGPVDTEDPIDVLEATNFYQFTLTAFQDNFEVVNDSMGFEVLILRAPDETDDNDDDNDFENVFSPEGDVWGEVGTAWSTGADPRTQRSRNYYTLGPDGWTTTAQPGNAIPRLEFLDDDYIRETHGGIRYVWEILDEDEITVQIRDVDDEQTFDIAGLHLDTYYIWLEYLFVTLPRQLPGANIRTPFDEMQWLSSDNVFDEDIYDDTIEDARFSEEAKIYTVSRRVVDTIYTIEPYLAGNNYAFTSIDFNLGAIATAVQALFPDLDIALPNSNIVDFRDVELAVIADGNILAAFIFDFEDTASDCANGGNTGDTVGVYYLATARKDSQDLDITVQIPTAVTLECVGGESIFIPSMSNEIKLFSGFGGYYDVFLTDANGTDLPGQFYMGRKYNRTADNEEPTKDRTAVPLVFYNQAAYEDLKSAWQTWRDKDHDEVR